MIPAPVATDDDPFLNFDEVATLFNFPKGTLRHLRVTRKGPPFIRRGRHLVIRKSKAVKWHRETFEDAAAE